MIDRGSLSNRAWEQRLGEKRGVQGSSGAVRDEKIREFDTAYGKDGWTLAWKGVNPANGFVTYLEFEDACKVFYEAAYVQLLSKWRTGLDFVCSYGGVHRQRPDQHQLGARLQEAGGGGHPHPGHRGAERAGPARDEVRGAGGRVLVIHGVGSSGAFLSPGLVPFGHPETIVQPSLCPKWALPGSVEDFWQSNKVLMVKSVTP